MKNSSEQKKGRKRKYIPGLAQLHFKPPYDWTKEEAARLYETALDTIKLSPYSVNEIAYEDCLVGMQQMPPESVDLVIADPPFGIDFSRIGSQYNRKKAYVAEGYAEISRESYPEFTEQWIGLLKRIMKPTASAYIVSGWTNLGDVLNALKKAGLTLVNHIIWKYQFGVFTKRKFVTSHYHILFVVKDEKKYFFNKFEYYPEDVWYIPREYMPGQEKNKTKLPNELVKKCINFSTKPGDVVFDPFMGNATTALCAKGLYRHYFGFEINKNLQPLHKKLLSSINPGKDYVPLKTYLPTVEELLQKYPHLKKYVTTDKTIKDFLEE